MVAGSHEDLSKSEHEHDAARKRLHPEISAERGQSVSKDLSHGLKCSETIEADVSVEHPCPKERRSERRRYREHRHPDLPERPPPLSYLFAPAGFSRPIRSSVSVLSMDPSRGSSPPGKGVGTEVSVPTEVPLSSIACQVAQSSGQLMNAQVGPVVMTSGLNAAQAEEIFLLSHEVQTLRGKLALDFIQMSHTEANFCMGAQATSHEYSVQEHPSTSRCGAVWPHSTWARKPGCTSILYSFVTLLIINSSWYGSSRGARRLSRLYMITFGKWSIGLWKVQANPQQRV